MRVFSYKGIPVEIHYSLTVLIVFLFIFQIFSSGLSSAIIYTSLLMCLFVSVLLHEFGHAIMAARFNIPTKKIMLIPFGGIALIDGRDLTPRSEFFIAIAGPIVNLIISIFFGAIAYFSSIYFIYYIVAINMIMAIFNMIPAYPMDGGRVVRSILELYFGRKRATKLAVAISTVISILFIIAGAMSGWISLFVIGVFLIVSNFSKKLTQKKGVNHGR